MKSVDDDLDSRLRAAFAADIESAAPPDSGHVWRVAQLHARREAVRNAGRPITAIQVMALACAFGLLGACFGATSEWFQRALGGAASRLGKMDPGAIVAGASALIGEHGAIVLAMLAVVLLVPCALYLTLARD
jgi:hypothetical protein